MKINYLRTLALALTSMAGSLMAQDLHTSYFMETAKYRHQMNPALLENAPYVGALLGNTNILLRSNVGIGALGFEMDSFRQSNRLVAKFISSESDNRFPQTSQHAYGGFGVNYNVVSIAFNAFKGTNLIEFNIRGYADVTFNNSLLPFSSSLGLDHHYYQYNANAQLNAYREIVLGHARRINNHFTIGAKAKLLLGFIHADTETNELRLSAGNYNRLWESPNILGFFKDPKDLDLSKSNQIRLHEFNYINGGIFGLDFGLDLGVTYKVHGLEDLTLSLGLNDISLLPNSNAKRSLRSYRGDWTFNGFNKAEAGSDSIALQRIEDDITRFKHQTGDPNSSYPIRATKHSYKLNTTLNLGAEYVLPMYRKLSFGFLFSQRFAGSYSSYKAMLSTRIRPVKAIELGVSASTSTFGTNIGAMLTLQAPAFQFFIGSDYLVQDLTKRSTPSANINFGFTFPLKSRPR